MTRHRRPAARRNPGDSVFERLTKRINGGLNGLKERQEIYARALEVLQ